MFIRQVVKLNQQSQAISLPPFAKPAESKQTTASSALPWKQTIFKYPKRKVAQIVAMSKDSSPTYIHFHHPRLADVFEDFNRPHTHTTPTTSSSSSSSSSTQQQPGAQSSSNTTTNPQPSTTNPSNTTNNNNTNNNNPTFLPIEDIYVSPQHQPVNPEDEDDVVPDQHAAFGIARAMDRRREVVWRDLGLEELMGGVRIGRAGGGGGGGGRGEKRGGAGRKVTCLR
ncbi:hypothetical protein AJ80_00703 [Polytolypa hystricis UAMH7299]|uniref:Uncharacterized protein n=1 Tax=Polytolypa hystricis (strain UAMH7299) TaxID=1447883 RepID=A0A2B7Z3I7_POLH7|nr:hypothetical protein AJ80_00703 [Polytolypa hystricis UAMH7299]